MYLGYQGDKIKLYTEEEPDVIKWNLDKVEETDEEYALNADRTEYVLKDAAWEEEQAAKERERLDRLTLTPADVRELYIKLKIWILQTCKHLLRSESHNKDTKALAIEFRAKDFFRGAEANGVRLFDTIGQLLGYKIPDDMDYLFEHKELPTQDLDNNEGEQNDN